MELEQKQFPIGKWKMKKKYADKEIHKFITILEKHPAKFKRLTKKLSETDLKKTYREGGWNVREVNEVAARAATNDRIVQLGYHKLYDPAFPVAVPVEAAITAAAPGRHQAALVSRSRSATYSAIAVAEIRRLRPRLTERSRPERISS